MFKFLWHKLPFTGDPAPIVNLLPMNGTIAPDTRTGKSLNLSGLEDSLRKAFTVGSPRAVILSINSPGGSPVQSRMILARARELAEKHKLPLITHIEDVGASGGYMLALAGDEIYADPFAIVGSIGVIAGGFGFPDALEKLGIERRVYTAGDHKGQLDPFRPESPRDVRRLEDLLEKSHKGFVGVVKDRRGERLKGSDDTLFNGDFWLAEDAKELGLIDGVEDMRAMLKRRFGDRVKIRPIPADKKGMLAKLMGASLERVIGPDAILGAIERKSLWSRFGR